MEPLAAIPDHDAALVDRIRRGDERAFEELYRAQHAALWRFAYGYVRSRDVAEELVQDVFLSLWGRRAAWTVTSGSRAWLFAAVRHLALNQLRHARVVARAHGTVASTPAPTVSATQIGRATMGQRAPGQHEVAEARELDDAMARAIADLPERRRIAMTLRWKEDMSPPEIAEVLGITPEAARVLLSRARTDLAEMLERLRE